MPSAINSLLILRCAVLPVLWMTRTWISDADDLHDNFMVRIHLTSINPVTVTLAAAVVVYLDDLVTHGVWSRLKSEWREL